MMRCCPEKCGNREPFTKEICEKSAGKGKCTYPNVAQCPLNYWRCSDHSYSKEVCTRMEDAKGNHCGWRNGTVKDSCFTEILKLGDGREGDWSDWEDCADTTYATGFEVKTHHSGCADCEGVNDLTIYCSGTNSSRNNTLDPKHHDRNYGDLQDLQECENYFSGAEIESYVNGKSYGVTNFAMHCFNGTSTNRLEGYPESSDWTHGEWREKRMCDDGTAICGFRVRIEKYLGVWYDDSGVNGIDVKCCPTDKE